MWVPWSVSQQRLKRQCSKDLARKGRHIHVDCLEHLQETVGTMGLCIKCSDYVAVSCGSSLLDFYILLWDDMEQSHQPTIYWHWWWLVFYCRMIFPYTLHPVIHVDDLDNDPIYRLWYDWYDETCKVNDLYSMLDFQQTWPEAWLDHRKSLTSGMALLANHCFAMKSTCHIFGQLSSAKKPLPDYHKYLSKRCTEHWATNMGLLPGSSTHRTPLWIRFWSCRQNLAHTRTHPLLAIDWLLNSQALEIR